MNKQYLLLLLRRMRKKINIYRDYYQDAKLYSNHYIESAEQHGNHEYRIMLLVHSIEKGLCMSDLRPFGLKKAYQLMSLLKKIEPNSCSEFEYNLGVSVLHSWIDSFEEHKWEKDEIVKEVETFIRGKSKSFPAGIKTYSSPVESNSSHDFSTVMLSRHTVRDYEPDELEQEDIDYAVNMFIEAPSACNRQMCKIYYIKNNKLKELLSSKIIGISGINKTTVNYFIITYEISAFDYSGERNQGYFNAGLAAMNFANGLHYKGIGSCFLQWANGKKDSITTMNALGIPMNERIAVILAAGYYKKSSMIPSSCRKPQERIFKAVE